MRSQARASSKAQVRHRAWAANTVGHGSRSTRRATATRSGEHALGLAGPRQRREQRHVDAAADDAALGAEQDRPRAVGLELGDGGVQAVGHGRVEQVERRRVEGDDRQPVLAGDGHRPTGPALRRHGAHRSCCRRGRDLVGVARRRRPRQPQRIAVVARDHVDVEVEDRLPGGRAARVEQVDAVGTEALGGRPRQPLRRGDGGGEVLGIDLEQVGRVPAGDDEGVAAGGGVDVHEGHGPLVLVHALGRDLAGDDLAEQAVGISVAHGRQLSAFVASGGDQLAGARDRLLARGHLAAEAGGLQLGQQVPHHRARLDAERLGQLVAAHAADGADRRSTPAPRPASGAPAPGARRWRARRCRRAWPAGRRRSAP